MYVAGFFENRHLQGTMRPYAIQQKSYIGLFSRKHKMDVQSTKSKLRTATRRKRKAARRSRKRLDALIILHQKLQW